MFDQEPIQPKKTDLLTCFELVVQEKTEKFDQEAQKIVQNQFFEKFEERGCVVVLNEQGDPITNFGFIDYPCQIRPASDQEGGEDEETEPVVSSDTEATATSVASRVNNDRLRFLQTAVTATATATDTTTTESTETTTETLTTGFTYCLAQSRICPNDAIKTNTNTGVNDVLNTLFVGSTKSTTSGSTDNTLFKTKLSKEVTNNYIGFRKIDPDTSFELDSTAFTANDYSDYQIKSTKVKISFDIKNNKSESLACYFGLSDIPKGSETPPTSEDIMSCKSGVMSPNLCSTQLLDVAGVDEDGWALFTANEKTVIEFNTVQGNLINGKTYYLWMTCRQNLVIARKYSTPLSVLSTNAALIPEKTTPACTTMASCTLACTKTSGNNFWPTCCGTAGVDSTNPNVCAAVAGYLKSLGLMIAVLFLFLF